MTGLSHRRSKAGSAGNSSWPLVRTPCDTTLSQDDYEGHSEVWLTA